MTGIVEDIREELAPECLVGGRLKKMGCAVSLKNAPKTRAIVDFDKPGSPLGPDESRCDYLFVAEGDGGPGWVAPLEVKKGSLEAGEVLRQLRAGASAAEKLVPRAAPVAFRPVAVSGSTPKAERDRLKDRSAKIRFHDRAEAVRLLSCGGSLMEALGR